MLISRHCKKDNIKNIIEIRIINQTLLKTIHYRKNFKNLMLNLMHCLKDNIQNIVEINASKEGI
jgi:hypothetical protein